LKLCHVLNLCSLGMHHLTQCWAIGQLDGHWMGGWLNGWVCNCIGSILGWQRHLQNLGSKGFGAWLLGRLPAEPSFVLLLLYNERSGDHHCCSRVMLCFVFVLLYNERSGGHHCCSRVMLCFVFVLSYNERHGGHRCCSRVMLCFVFVLLYNEWHGGHRCCSRVMFCFVLFCVVLLHNEWPGGPSLLFSRNVLFCFVVVVQRTAPGAIVAVLARGSFWLFCFVLLHNERPGGPSLLFSRNVLFCFVVVAPGGHHCCSRVMFWFVPGAIVVVLARGSFWLFCFVLFCCTMNGLGAIIVVLA